MSLLLIVFLTLLNGVFAMSELALASSRKARLVALSEAGDRGAAAALKLLESPTQFLSTVQVGITSIGVLNGIVGEAAFSTLVGGWLLNLGMAEKPASILATALVVAAITFTTIIFGELVPKRIGQLFPEQVARVVAPAMSGLAAIAKPFVMLLSLSTSGILKLLRINNQSQRAVTEEEIAASLEEGVDAGLIEESEHQMVRNVFHLDDRPLTSLMAPRSEIDWLDETFTIAQALEKVSSAAHENLHSWYPVCRENLDEVVGTVSLAQLLSLGRSCEDLVSQHMSAAIFVPETLSGMEMLEHLRAKSARMVFVVDEYGVVQGLVTPRDLLEAITGELQPSAPMDAWAMEREDGSWLLDGTMPVNELKSRLDIKQLPDQDKGRYNTLAGLLMSISGRLPTLGERIDCDKWQFEVVDLDGRRIDKVIAHHMPIGSSNLSL
jgi:putative hemolysin